MAAKQRASEFEKQVRSAEEAGMKLTAVMTFTGFPIFAQPAMPDCPIRLWAFSYGINATFQYGVDATKLPRMILNSPVEKEFDSDNGEGVDVFTIHGIKKQQLIVTIYPSVNEAPYWFKQAHRPARANSRGLFLLLSSRIPSQEEGKMVKVMEWPFFQMDNVSFDGGVNTMKNLQGPQISVSFEPDNILK